MRRVGGLLACALVAVGLVALVPSAASAAACTRGTGVTVVVDGNQLGGLSTTCVAGGGSSATSAFSSAGVSLRYASRMPGFVCQVNGKPASAPCVNASPSNAYWSLWWSKGDGVWTYAQVGVQSLSIPKGGWVAWSWQGQSATSAPSVTPQGPAATASPTRKPAAGTGSSSGSSPAPSGTSTATQKAQTEAQAEQKAAVDEELEKVADKKARAEASASTSASASASSGPSSNPDTRATSATTDSAPPWSTIGGIAAVLALLAAAGVVAWRRRSDA